jgi:hypothetical protein
MSTIVPLALISIFFVFKDWGEIELDWPNKKFKIKRRTEKKSKIKRRTKYLLPNNLDISEKSSPGQLPKE